MDVELLTVAGTVIKSWLGITTLTVEPPPETTCFLHVSGNKPTRYWIGTGLRVKKGVLPGPLQKELEVLPKYWDDPPPFAIGYDLTHYALEVGEAERADGEIAFEVPTSVSLQLLNSTGEVVAEAMETPTETAEGQKALVFDLHGLDSGTYALEVQVNSSRESQKGSLRMVVPPRIRA